MVSGEYRHATVTNTSVPKMMTTSIIRHSDDYLALGEKEKGEAILNDLANKSVEYIT